jgi:uncharacterized protein YprB with RNaseH-like and TPR domain
MLLNTFCHIQGIGENTERKLWSAGVTSWDCLLRQKNCEFSPRFRSSWLEVAEESRQEYRKRNLDYFAESLPSREHWRLFRDFQDSCAFLDVETTGLWQHDKITTIALYDGKIIRHYVRGQNLNRFARDVRDYRLLVTYNGRSFDAPFIKRELGIELPQAHIDLRHILRSLNFSGGLKACARRLGIAHLASDISGEIAPLLWDEYFKHGDEKALQTLLAYNIHDAVCLHPLMILAYNRKISDTPFAKALTLRPCRQAKVPFAVDPATLRRIRRKRSIAFPAWYQQRLGI